MRLVDLSHTIEPEMPSFSADWPKPEITPWMSHAQSAQTGRYEGCTCEITEARFLTSLGTYLDSPFHFDPQGAAIDALDLDQLVLPGLVIDCTDVGAQAAIGPDVFASIDLTDKAVLFHTGWDRHWGGPEYSAFPYLTESTAKGLRDGGAKLVGVDTMIVDNPADPRRPVHVTLLHSQVLIVENLTGLAGLPREGFTFHAVPAKVGGAAAFPVRAYAAIHEDPR